jgi:hypothetical protein
MDDFEGMLVTTYDPNARPDSGAITRIVASIIGHAINDGASEIHIQVPSEQRGFRVFYRLAGHEALHEQMKIPVNVFKPLRDHLENLADENGAFKIDLTSEKHRISLTYVVGISVRNAPEGETILLTLKGTVNSLR